MLDRTACERRVYRLATLLTGNPDAATEVISEVLDAQPDLRALDSAHLDRLTVLRSRETRQGRIRDDRVPAAAASALADLTEQQREAWVFHRVYNMTEREIARAMDCSVRAAQTHLAAAMYAMHAALGDGQDEAAGALLRYTLSFDVPAIYRERVRRRKQWRILGRIALATFIVAIIIASVLILERIGLFDALIRPG